MSTLVRVAEALAVWCGAAVLAGAAFSAWATRCKRRGRSWVS